MYQRYRETEKDSSLELLGDSVREVCLKGRTINVESECIAGLINKLGKKYPNEIATLTKIAEQLKEDRELRRKVVLTLTEKAHRFSTVKELQEIIQFNLENESWWSKEVEKRLSTMAEHFRSHIKDENTATDFDIQVGAVKGAYKFVKGAVLAVPELLGYLGKLATNSDTRQQAIETYQAITLNAIKLQFGTAAQKKEAASKILETGTALWTALTKEFSEEWEYAVSSGREAELVSEWITRGLLEIATLALGAVKGAQVADRVAVVAKEVKEGTQAIEITAVRANFTKLEKAAPRGGEASNDSVEIISKYIEKKGADGPTVKLRETRTTLRRNQSSVHDFNGQINAEVERAKRSNKQMLKNRKMDRSMGSRRRFLREWYKENHNLRQKKLRQHIFGSNLVESAKVKKFRVGEVFEQYVRTGGQPGYYGAPFGSDPYTLGIVLEGREIQRFEITKKGLEGIETIVADYPERLVSGVGGKGAGTQFILPREWLNYVRRVK